MRSSPILHKPIILQKIIIFSLGKKFGLQQGLINVPGNVFLNKNGPRNLYNRQNRLNGDFLRFQFLDLIYVRILVCPKTGNFVCWCVYVNKN